MNGWTAIRRDIDTELGAAIDRFGDEYQLDRVYPGLTKEIRVFVTGHGRRLRPLLYLGILRAYNAPLDQRNMTVATAIELLHACALIHDDLIDGADSRRGSPAFHHDSAHPDSIDGLARGVIGGDLLYTFSMQLLASIDSSEPSRAAIKHILEVAAITSAAQLEEMRFDPHDDPTASLERLLELYDRKSGLYTFCAPLELGRLLACGPEVDRAPLRHVGIHLGRAYQLRDDLTDIAALRNINADEMSLVPPWELNLIYALSSTMSAPVDRQDMLAAGIERLHNDDEFTGFAQTVDSMIESEVHAARDRIDDLTIAPEVESMVESIGTYLEEQHGTA